MTSLLGISAALVVASLFLETTEALKPTPLSCEGCHGVISELHEKLSKPASGAYSARVPRLLEKICTLENLVKYVYSPPKMVRACNELLDAHKKEIQKSLIQHFEANSKVTLHELEAAVCFQISGVCKGIKDSPAENLRDKIQADHVLKPEGDGKIVFEQQGDQIVPKAEKGNKPSKESKEKKKPEKVEL
ncbi:uncharacterized protein LOC129584621 [Paramacrobiotus metropolitanus]|uniref:uncharacterized protein LOC129584621 n=1 Tax=Paramacrobiotus metropolitanus TaxID=2943436 RepID=UPI0024464352|nr:uncharacterized protein LOC129584621 [Paramacrobiotus metropolitanus]